MIQDLWPGNFSQLPPGMTQEEITFPLDLTSNEEFCRQDPNRTYPILLMHEPQSLSALHYSLRDAFNGTLPLSIPLIPNEGHVKYVCLDPWINALVTLASLGTIVAFLMVRCRKRTLCRGLEYATACHIYVFISRNDRYSPIKLCSTTGLLYNFVTNQRLPIEALVTQGMPMG